MSSGTTTGVPGPMKTCATEEISACAPCAGVRHSGGKGRRHQRSRSAQMTTDVVFLVITFIVFLVAVGVAVRYWRRPK